MERTILHRRRPQTEAEINAAERQQGNREMDGSSMHKKRVDYSNFFYEILSNPNYTDREQASLIRHIMTRLHYESLGDLNNWETRVAPSRDYREALANIVVSSGILPRSHPSGNPPLLVSLSAHTGLHEQVLAQKLADNKSRYRVVAGDMADLTRVLSAATHMRFDASFLPFAKGSVSAMYDHFGAIWHEAEVDGKLTRDATLFDPDNPAFVPEYTRDIFASLREVLQPGGVIIVDENSSENSTAAKIDLATGGRQIPGFTTDTIGDGTWQLRVYKKVP
jgi:hypothetical protein